MYTGQKVIRMPILVERSRGPRAGELREERAQGWCWCWCRWGGPVPGRGGAAHQVGVVARERVDDLAREGLAVRQPAVDEQGERVVVRLGHEALEVKVDVVVAEWVGHCARGVAAPASFRVGRRSEQGEECRGQGRSRRLPGRAGAGGAVLALFLGGGVGAYFRWRSARGRS